MALDAVREGSVKFYVFYSIRCYVGIPLQTEPGPLFTKR